MSNLTIEKVEVTVTPKQVASIFSNFDNQEQALFFNQLAEEIKEYTSPFVFQLQSIIDSGILTDDALEMMREIGEYASQKTN